MPNRAGLYRYQYKNATITTIVMQLHSTEVYLQTSVNEHWGRVIEMLRNDHEMKISIVLSAVTTACYGLSKQRLIHHNKQVVDTRTGVWCISMKEKDI